MKSRPLAVVLFGAVLGISLVGLLGISSTSGHMSFGGHIYSNKTSSSYQDPINVVFTSTNGDAFGGGYWSRSQNHLRHHTGFGDPVLSGSTMHFLEHGDKDYGGFFAQDGESGTCCIALERWHIRYKQGVDSDTSGWVGRYTVAAVHYDKTDQYCAYHVGDRFNEGRYHKVSLPMQQGGHVVSMPGMTWERRAVFTACDGTPYMFDKYIDFVSIPNWSH